MTTESASACCGHGRRADPPPTNVPFVIALFHNDDAATAAAATKKAFAEREVAESVAAATRESIRGRLLQYYEMHDDNFDRSCDCQDLL